METIFLVGAPILTTIIGIGQLLVEWKYHDKRTTPGRRIRTGLICVVILLGLVSIGLAIINVHNQQKLALNIAYMKGVLGQKPEFSLYVNGNKVVNDTTISINKIKDSYPLQISFVNIGTKSANGVLIEVIGPIDYRKITAPWSSSYGYEKYSNYSSDVYVRSRQSWGRVG